MRQERAVEQMNRLAIVLVAIALSLAVTRLWSEETLNQKCRWQKCGQIAGEPINCDAEEMGTARDLVNVIQKTKSGSVVWDCGVGK